MYRTIDNIFFPETSSTFARNVIGLFIGTGIKYFTFNVPFTIPGRGSSPSTLPCSLYKCAIAVFLNQTN